MNLSVCMIVKNEEKVLARCLDCVKKFADEIIIVDTGSTDKTKKIASKYTSKIFDFVWINDFARARNYSFSFATCDYIMWLDADDIITDDNIDKIIKLKQNNFENADLIMCKYAVSFDENSNAIFSYNRERFFKRSMKFLWQGFVHEAIAPRGKILYNDIEIEHRKIKSTDPKRNLKIYLSHKKNGLIFDARSQYYFGKEYYYLGRYKKCVTELKKFLKLPNKFAPNVVDAKLHISKCYKYLQKNDLALSTLFDLIKNDEINSEILCEIADTYVEIKNYQKALFFYQSALNISPNYRSGAFIDNNYYYFIPLINLVVLYYNQGNIEKAKYYQSILNKDYPNNEMVKYNNQFFSK